MQNCLLNRQSVFERRHHGPWSPDDNTRMTISQFVGEGMKSAWINKDLIKIDVLEQLKILIIHLAINKT